MQHTWSDFKSVVLKLRVKSWQDISTRLNVPLKDIKAWAVDDCVPDVAFVKLARHGKA